MGKYVHLFNSQSEFEESYYGTGYTWPWISYVKQKDKLKYNKDQGVFNGHDYIDLGLPSGTLWAACNVGASSPEEHGGYFAWGETSEKNRVTGYTINDYKLTNDGGSTYIRYNNIDHKYILDTGDDVCHVIMGGQWKMPTDVQLQELLTGCTSASTTLNTVNGVRLTSNINGNSIFIPFSGLLYDGSLRDLGTSGRLWSCNRNTSNVAKSFVLRYYSYYIDVDNGYDRYKGFSVRGVIGNRD